MQKSAQKGFTLIELLVVIAIVAILSVVVILTLNPAELIKQSRDANRISDLNVLKGAISLFLVDTASSTGLVGSSSSVAGVSGLVNGGWYNCFIDLNSSQYGVGAASSTTNCNWFGNLAAGTAIPPALLIVASTSPGLRRNVDGTGWVPVRFTAMSSGAPIGNLPVDPLDSSNNFYSYRASSTGAGFKLVGRLESAKYGLLGPSDAVSTDGGNSILDYETGSSITY